MYLTPNAGKHDNDNNQTNNNKQDREIVDSALHRIVNWEATQDTVNDALDKCSVCKQRGLKLVETSRISLASMF